MEINWNTLAAWMLGRKKMPLGWSLEYEFRPSLPWHVELHEACRYWHSLHPEQHRTDFWHLSKKERMEWGEKFLQKKYKIFTNRPHWDCQWQRFTVTDINGKQFVFQMDYQGSVKQIKIVKKLVEIEEWVEIR